MRFWALWYFIAFLTNYWIKNLWPLIYNWLVTPNFAHPKLFHHNHSSHTAQIIEDIHAKCNIFLYFRLQNFDCICSDFSSVLGPFSNSQFDTFHLHLSYFRAIFLSNSSVHYSKHLSTCHRQTNVFSKV